MKLEVIEDRYTYRIAWVDEDGVGLHLGEALARDPGPHASRDDREIWIADEAAAPFASDDQPNKNRGCTRGFAFEPMAKAAAALRAVKAALKAEEDGRPLPDWARAALAAGWKAPRGWKP